ncbi:uncharacterized protein LOC117785061 [Drosophila innubila]|uniref:uncharacterized protein LOC117785061 n=1 Tax=Drosophila innubila TaxID=198719 RepID=UPI00148CE0FF|nr:uncharacterized protein LOC117785061 [Drosophila innubila]
MKTFTQLFVFGLLLLNLIVALQAGLLFTRNGVIYCKLSTRGSCDNISPFCVQIKTADAAANTNLCKNYKSECQYMIENCLGKTQYGRNGLPVAASVCTTATISVGLTGNCA